MSGAGYERDYCPFCGGTLSYVSFYDEEAVDGFECDGCGAKTLGSHQDEKPLAKDWDWPPAFAIVEPSV